MARSLPTNQTLKSFLPLFLAAVGTTVATATLVTTLVQTQIGNLQMQITGIDQRTQSQLTSLQTLIGSLHTLITGIDERIQSQFENVNTAIESVRYDSDNNIETVRTEIRAIKEETAWLIAQIGSGTSLSGQ